MSETEIINTYDQNRAAGGDRIVIWRQTEERGRWYRAESWQVGRIRDGEILKTEPTEPWYNYGKKTFSLSSRGNGESLKDFRARVLAEAISWANTTFGQREFVKNSRGDYVEKEVNEKFPISKRPK